MSSDSYHEPIPLQAVSAVDMEPLSDCEAGRHEHFSEEEGKFILSAASAHDAEETCKLDGVSFASHSASTAASEPPEDAPAPPSMENDEEATALLMGSTGAKSFVIKQAPPKTICKENAQLAEFAIVLKYSNTLPLNNLRLDVTGKKAQFGVRQGITFDRRAGSRSYQVKSYETPIIGEAECIVRDQDQLILVLLKANRKNRVGTYDFQFFDEKRAASEAMEVEIKSKPNVKYGKAISRNEPPSRIDNEKIIKTVQDKYVRDLRALKDSFNNGNCPEVSCFDPSILGDIFDRNKSMNRLTPRIKSEPSATSRVSHSLNQLQLFPKRAREDEEQTAEGVFKKFKALAPAERTRFEEMFNMHMHGQVQHYARQQRKTRSQR